MTNSVPKRTPATPRGDFSGPEKMLVDITPASVADAALRRAHAPEGLQSQDEHGRVDQHTTTPSSVNRQLIQTLRRLLKYSRYTLGVPVDLTQFVGRALQ